MLANCPQQAATPSQAAPAHDVAIGAADGPGPDLPPALLASQSSGSKHSSLDSDHFISASTRVIRDRERFILAEKRFIGGSVLLNCVRVHIGLARVSLGSGSEAVGVVRDLHGFVSHLRLAASDPIGVVRESLLCGWEALGITSEPIAAGRDLAGGVSELIVPASESLGSDREPPAVGRDLLRLSREPLDAAGEALLSCRESLESGRDSIVTGILLLARDRAPLGRARDLVIGIMVEFISKTCPLAH